VHVETFHIDNGPLIQCQIAFSIAARKGRGVVQISKIGIKAPQQIVAQKCVVITCVTKLTNIGYTPPTLSSDADMCHDVEGFCASIAPNNRNDVVKSKSKSNS
jgi:hypothetical protein